MKRKSTRGIRLCSCEKCSSFFLRFCPKRQEILSTFFHSKSPYIKYEREQNALLREERNDDDDDDDNTENDDDDEAKRDA
jgi:hypothetical protein